MARVPIPGFRSEDSGGGVSREVSRVELALHLDWVELHEVGYEPVLRM